MVTFLSNKYLVPLLNVYVGSCAIVLGNSNNLIGYEDFNTHSDEQYIQYLFELEELYQEERSEELQFLRDTIESFSKI
jgi:hypothetical protein